MPKWIREWDVPHGIRTDAFRFYLLHEYGGVWFDADNIHLGRIDWKPDDFDVIGTYNRWTRRGWGVNGLLGNPIAGRKGSPFFKLCYDRVKQAYRKDKRWGATSVGLLSRVWKHRDPAWECVRYDHEAYHPIPWYKSQMFEAKVPKNHTREWFQGWNPNAFCYHTTSRCYHKDCYAGNTFFTFLYQKAMCQAPACQPWSSQYVEWIPADSSMLLAEVGVMKARNMATILQQRRNVRMIGVDTWSVRKSDWYKGWDDMRWERIYAIANKVLQPFSPQRWQFMRLPSLEAARHIDPDAVILDADHSTEAVYNDLCAWWRPGILFMGHDYGHPDYGVKVAVDAFASERGLRVTTGRQTCYRLEEIA